MFVSMLRLNLATRSRTLLKDHHFVKQKRNHMVLPYKNGAV